MDCKDGDVGAEIVLEDNYELEFYVKFFVAMFIFLDPTL